MNICDITRRIKLDLNADVNLSGHKFLVNVRDRTFLSEKADKFFRVFYVGENTRKDEQNGIVVKNASGSTVEEIIQSGVSFIEKELSVEKIVALKFSPVDIFYSACISSVFVGFPPSQIIKKNKDEHLKKSLDEFYSKEDPSYRKPIEVLYKFSTRGFIFSVGIIFGTAIKKNIFIVDNFTSSAAALMAVILSPRVKNYIRFIGSEDLNDSILKRLGIKSISV